MKKWILSDLAEFGRLDDGSKINLHGTTYVCHSVNRWNDSVLLEDIGLQPEPIKSEPYLDITKSYDLVEQDGSEYLNVSGSDIVDEFPTWEEFTAVVKSYKEIT